jgi:hypothetical protein
MKVEGDGVGVGGGSVTVLKMTIQGDIYMFTVSTSRLIGI